MSDELVTLMSSEGEAVQVAQEVAFKSETIKNMIEDTGTEAPIPLPNVSSKILQKVIEYCKHHSEKKEGEGNKEEEDKTFDAEFVKVDQATLFELILVR